MCDIANYLLLFHIIIDSHSILIFTFKAFIDRTAPLYLCELIEQQKSKTNTRLAGDAFLLKLPPPSRNCADTFFERSFLYGDPYEWNKLDERVRRLTDFNMFKRCYFYVIWIISMISLLADYNSMVIFLNIHLYVPLYILNLYCVTIIIYCISVFIVH